MRNQVFQLLQGEWREFRRGDRNLCRTERKGGKTLRKIAK